MVKPHVSIALIMTLLVSSCFKDKYEETKICVMNNSNDTIYVSFTTDYPDTTFFNVTNPLFNPQINMVKPHCLQSRYHGSPSKEIFDDKIDTLIFFIFKNDVLIKNKWETVQSEYFVSKRYDLSLNDLEKSNWIIEYPCTKFTK